MSSNFLICSGKLVEAATVTGSATASLMPWTKLQNGYPSRRTRSSGLSSVYTQLDFGSAVSFNTVWLGYSNARSATQWQIRSNSAASWGGSVDHDSTAMNFWPASSPSTIGTDFPRGTFGLYTTPALATWTDRYMRIDITDGTHPDNYFQFGVLIVALAINPQSGPATDSDFPIEVSPAARTRSVSGTLFPIPQPISTEASFHLGSAGRADIRALKNLARERGSHKQVLVVPDYTDTAYLHDTVIHGYLNPLKSPDLFGYSTSDTLQSIDIGITEA